MATRRRVPRKRGQVWAAYRKVDAKVCGGGCPFFHGFPGGVVNCFMQPGGCYYDRKDLGKHAPKIKGLPACEARAQ